MYVEFGIYIVEGTILFIVSFLLVFSLIRTPKLAERYSLIIAQYCTNAVLGFATVLAGTVRIAMLFFNYSQLKSIRFCMLMPWNIMFTWAETMMPVMFFVIGFDRLLSLLFPLIYFKSGSRLQLIQIAISHGVLIILVLQCWIETFQDNENTREPVCWTTDAMKDHHVFIFFVIQMASALSSVVLYIISYFLLRQQISKTNYQGEALRVFEQRQRQLTMTMCLSCFFTIVLYVMPVIAVFITTTTKDLVTDGFIKWYVVVSGDMNCVINVGVIYWKQTDIADAIRRNLKFLNIKSHQSSAPVILCPRVVSTVT